MKGLFMKDMMTFLKVNKITGMIGTVALLVFLLAMKHEIGFYIANFIILPLNAGTQPSLLSFYDDQWKWKPYLIALPVSSRDIVGSRMLSSFAIFAIQCIGVELFNVAFLMLHPEFSRELFVFVILASVLLGMLCLLICIVIDFVMKNNRTLAVAIQLALIVLGAGGIYAVSKAQVNIIELLLSVSSAAILGILAAILLGTVIATYFVCIPAVQKR